MRLTIVGRAQVAREFDAQRRRLEQSVDAHGAQGAGKSLIAVGRLQFERRRRRVDRAELPHPPPEAVGSAMQRVLLAGLAREVVHGAVEREAAVGDAVGEAAGHRAEVRRMGDVILDRIEAERHPLLALPERHDEIAQHRAPGENLGGRPRFGSDRRLEHRGALVLPERMHVHARSPSPSPPRRSSSRASRRRPYRIDGASRCARAAAKTARNISGVNVPVFVL